MGKYVYQVFFLYDNGCCVDRLKKIVVSKKDLSQKEIEHLIAQHYSGYDDSVYDFLITPVVFQKSPYIL